MSASCAERIRCLIGLAALAVAAPSFAQKEVPAMTDRPPAAASRIPLPPRETLNANQRAIYDQAVAFFGAPIGPRMVFLDTPEVGLAWSNLLTQLETSKLPKDIWELSILLVAREWDSRFEWYAHEKAALKAGVAPAIVEAVRLGRLPTDMPEHLAATHAYVTELYRNRHVLPATYSRLAGLIGSRQLIELTVLIGHYNNVAMTLNAHEVPLPPGVEVDLPPVRH